MMNLETDIRRRLLNFYEPQDVEIWMATPQPRWEGLSARDMFAAGRGLEVDAAVDQLETGAFI